MHTNTHTERSAISRPKKDTRKGEREGQLLLVLLLATPSTTIIWWWWWPSYTETLCPVCVCPSTVYYYLSLFAFSSPLLSLRLCLPSLQPSHVHVSLLWAPIRRNALNCLTSSSFICAFLSLYSSRLALSTWTIKADANIHVHSFRHVLNGLCTKVHCQMNERMNERMNENGVVQSLHASRPFQLSELLSSSLVRSLKAVCLSSSFLSFPFWELTELTAACKIILTIEAFEEACVIWVDSRLSPVFLLLKGGLIVS